MRVFFPKPLTYKCGTFVGRDWFFVKDHTIWYGWVPEDYKVLEKPRSAYKLWKELAREGVSGSSYEEALKQVTEEEPENPLKGKFIKLLQRKIKERDAEKAQRKTKKGKQQKTRQGGRGKA